MSWPDSRTVSDFESQTRLRSKVFSLERLWIKLLALKGFGLVGLEYKAKKSLDFKLGFCFPHL